jgi:hypothetical protein
MNIKKTAISAGIAMALGAAGTAQADIVKFNWTGVFTMLNPVGDALTNSNSSFKSGLQTKISGTMVFNNSMTASQSTIYDLNGAGTQAMTLGPGAGASFVNPFGFFGGGNAVAHDIAMQAIGDGGGGPGTLVAGNMLFDWSGNNNITTQIVLNAGGFFTSTVSTSTGVVTAGAGAVANFFEPLVPCTGENSSMVCTASQSLNKGPVLMSTQDGNPFVNEMVDPDGTGTNLGAYNRHSDGVSGIAMDNGPFPGFSANFDVWAMTLTAYEPAAVIPVPAAVWLFGSGLLGLVGVARRRKGSQA